jgi:peptidoglycan/LPS O-acetylase OafA/YrhL
VRINQLDGLRGCAVLLVLLFHHGLIRSGWVGVDIFFVLSGFLITGILRRETSSPNYWQSFYLKRATRILPAMILLLTSVFILAGHFKVIYLGYLFFASNVVQLSPLALGPLAALWSLAIEEHFYFVWPLAVKKLNRDRLLKLSLGIVVVSPFLRIAGTVLVQHVWGSRNNWDNPIFLLTPFRIDGLAAGAALALLLEEGRCPAFLRRWSGIASLAAAFIFLGLEFFVKSFRRTTDNLLFNGFGYSLVVLSSFFLVSFLVLKPNSAVTRILSSKMLVFIGTISYGFYLYQQLAQHITRIFITTATSRLLFLPDLITTAILATASFYLIEKPIIGWGKARLTNSNTMLIRSEQQAVMKLTFPPAENA